MGWGERRVFHKTEKVFLHLTYLRCSVRPHLLLFGTPGAAASSSANFDVSLPHHHQLPLAAAMGNGRPGVGRSWPLKARVRLQLDRVGHASPDGNLALVALVSGRVAGGQNALESEEWVHVSRLGQIKPAKTVASTPSFSMAPDAFSGVGGSFN